MAFIDTKTHGLTQRRANQHPYSNVLLGQAHRSSPRGIISPSQRRLLQQHCHGIHSLAPLLSSINDNSGREMLLRVRLYVNSFHVELLIINTDSFEGESNRHLAAIAFNENVHG